MIYRVKNNTFPYAGKIFVSIGDITNNGKIKGYIKIKNKFTPNPRYYDIDQLEPIQVEDFDLNETVSTC